MATFTWKISHFHKELSPITQVYGVCFNKEGDILIQRSSKTGNWNLPGGHPENMETPNKTLARELDEEVSVTIKKSQMIGYFDVASDEHVFQLRYACIVDNILPMKIDPSPGKINERKFVKPNEFFTYVKITDYQPMIDEAVKWYQENNF